MPILAFSPLLNPGYWFNTNPVPFGASLVGSLFVFFAWFIVLAIGLLVAARWFKAKNTARAEVLKRFASVSFWTGLLGLIVLFFSYEQIPFFGIRAWFLAVGAFMLYKVVRIVLYIVREYPQEQAKAEEKRLQDRYMPHRN